MKNYQVLTLENQVINFSTPEPHPTFPSFFAFGVTKGGSTLLNNILIDICQQYHQIPHVSLPDILFAQGIKPEEVQPETLANLYEKSGYCFGGFRRFYSFFSPFLPGRKKILLVRDPRDIIVSLYFSEKYSHQIPQADTAEGRRLRELRNSLQNGLDLIDFIEKRKVNLKTILNSYQDAKNWDSLKLLRYEDVVLKKKEWIKEISQFLELPLTQEQITEILGRYDIIPSTEQKTSHIRKVIPGDYKEKLNAETIAKLNEYFQDTLVRYQYEF